jgi:hypothetical protein
MLSPVMMNEHSFDRMFVDRYDLTTYLRWIWQTYFADSPCINNLSIEYCYPWKARLGLIRLSLDATLTFIGVNTLLYMQQVPECVLITTIAHEIVHYIHGFGSPLAPRYRHPHANQVVERELEQRGLAESLLCCNEWIDKYWYSFYDMQRATGWAGIQGVKHPMQRVGK